jgi:hypothetical protein
MTGSKAGWLSAVVVGAVTCVICLSQWRWRAVALSAVTLIMVLALVIPSLRERLAASAGVRLDYWQAASTLIMEQPLSGHGLEGFENAYPRVKSPSAEETIIVHQEWLQTAVDMGVPAALLLSIWWIALLRGLWPRGSSPKPTTDREPVATSLNLRAVFFLSTILLAFALFQVGVLSNSFQVYPGNRPIVWGLLFLGWLVGSAWWFKQQLLPSPLSYWLALLAVLLHAQADFSLHSMQVVGVLAWVVCLGLSLRPYAKPALNSFPNWRKQIFPLAGLLLLIGVTIGVKQTGERGELRIQAQQAEGVLQRLRLGEQNRLGPAQYEKIVKTLEYMAGQIITEEGKSALAADPSETLTMGMLRRLIPASQSFPADSDLAFLAVNIAGHFQRLKPERAAVITPYLEELISAWPQQLACVHALSDHYFRLAQSSTSESSRALARQAQAFAQRAVLMYPTHLPFRAQLIRTAKLTGDQVTVEQQQAEIKHLAPLVHVDNQLRSE